MILPSCWQHWRSALSLIQLMATPLLDCEVLGKSPQCPHLKFERWKIGDMTLDMLFISNSYNYYLLKNKPFFFVVVAVNTVKIPQNPEILKYEPKICRHSLYCGRADERNVECWVGRYFRTGMERAGIATGKAGSPWREPLERGAQDSGALVVDSCGKNQTYIPFVLRQQRPRLLSLCRPVSHLTCSWACSHGCLSLLRSFSPTLVLLSLMAYYSLFYSFPPCFPLFVSYALDQAYILLQKIYSFF